MHDTWILLKTVDTHYQVSLINEDYQLVPHQLPNSWIVSGIVEGSCCGSWAKNFTERNCLKPLSTRHKSNPFSPVPKSLANTPHKPTRTLQFAKKTTVLNHCGTAQPLVTLRPPKTRSQKIHGTQDHAKRTLRSLTQREAMDVLLIPLGQLKSSISGVMFYSVHLGQGNVTLFYSSSYFPCETWMKQLETT